MGSAQTSIEALVGPPVVCIPFLNYPNGTYNPTNTDTGLYINVAASGDFGTIADFSNYRGAIMQVMVSRPISTNAPAVTVIPYHGPCPDFVTHDPFGAGWGIYVNGDANASPGTTVLRSIFIDTEKSMSHLSCQLTVNATSSALVGVNIIPVLPKTSAKLDEYTAGDLLTVLDSGPLNLV